MEIYKAAKFDHSSDNLPWDIVNGIKQAKTGDLH